MTTEQMDYLDDQKSGSNAMAPTVEEFNAAEYPAEAGERTGPVVIAGQAEADSAPVRPSVELFSLDGKTYTMPADLRPAVTLRFFRDVRTMGYEQAWVKLMSSALPHEAMDALAESEKVQPEHIAQVMSIVTETALGSIKRMREAAGER